jgi:hypothetical protein
VAKRGHSEEEILRVLRKAESGETEVEATGRQTKLPAHLPIERGQTLGRRRVAFQRRGGRKLVLVSDGGGFAVNPPPTASGEFTRNRSAHQFGRFEPRLEDLRRLLLGWNWRL